MKRLLTTIVIALMSFGGISAQKGYYTKAYSKKDINEARKWIKSGEWRQGFIKASPDESLNIAEFYSQYKKNPGQWQALFRWIADTDLLSIPKGKHPIEGTSLVASVEDSENGPLEKRNSESHYHHIDFQYCVKGTERFGIIDHVTSTPKDKYKPDVIHYNYDAKHVRFYDSRPDRFFIFFPCDWHIAKVNNDTDDQSIRVIVIKVDYVE